MKTTDSNTPTAADEKTGFAKWFPLVILSLALAIIILDTTILNVSLRTIINDLHTDIQSIQWVITAYSLVLAAFTITGGRLGDLFGRKKMFITGAIIFAVGSFIASISPNVQTMILGEAIIEGIGAALMMPATASLLVSNYRGRDRQIGFGVWGGIAAASAALGPVLGGWMTTYWSWRWAFRINVFVVLLLVVGAMVIREARDREEKPTIDFVGILLSSLGLLTMVFGFIKASDYGWLNMKQNSELLGFHFSKGDFSPVPVFITIGVIILGLFTLWEKAMMKRGITPLVSLNLFRNKQFTTAASITTVLSFAMAGLQFSTPVFLQAVRHLNALDTGIAMLPMSLSLLVAAPSSAFLSKYISPKRIIQIGLLLGSSAFLVLRQGIQVTSDQWALAPGFMLFGIGMGFLMSQTNNLALSAVSVEEAGEVSGVNGTMRTVGQTLGAAVLGAVLISTLTTSLVNGVNASSVIPDQAKPTVSQKVSEETSNIEFGSGSVVTNNAPQPIVEEITKISQQATVDGAHTTLLIGMGVMLLGFLISFLLPNSRDIETGKSLASAH